MELKSFGFGYSGALALGFDEALQRTKEVLARHGFGVQAEIQISATLKAKLGVDIPREVILGVCNPGLAYKAIQAEPEITVLLPCNVTVRETPEGVLIGAADPRKLIEVAGNPHLKDVALQAEKLLMEALSEL